MILNESGGSLQASIDELRERIESRFAERSVEAVIVATRGADLLKAARASFQREGEKSFDAVVVAGGDGSVNALANVLAGTEMPLGVLPLGTLNHFAKDLGLPLSIEEAVDVIAAGMTRHVDVAEVNERIFVNNSSVGIYPYMVADRERQQQGTARGKWTAMGFALLRMLRRFPLRRLAICADGWVRARKTPCVFVGNNVYGLSLFDLGTRPALDRGELCVYIVNHQSRWGIFWLGLRAVFGHLDQDRDFETLRLPSVEIRSHASRLPVSIDGEIALMRPPLRYRIRPKALRVLAPPPTAEQSG